MQIYGVNEFMKNRHEAFKGLNQHTLPRSFLMEPEDMRCGLQITWEEVVRKAVTLTGKTLSFNLAAVVNLISFE